MFEGGNHAALRALARQSHFDATLATEMLAAARALDDEVILRDLVPLFQLDLKILNENAALPPSAAHAASDLAEAQRGLGTTAAAAASTGGGSQQVYGSGGGSGGDGGGGAPLATAPRRLCVGVGERIRFSANLRSAMPCSVKANGIFVRLVIEEAKNSK